jgi:hypothetical protein
MEIDLSEKERSRNRARFPGVPVEEPGRHFFLVEVQNEAENEWHQVAAIPLMIVFRPSEEEQPDGSSE